MPVSGELLLKYAISDKYRIVGQSVDRKKVIKLNLNKGFMA